MELLISSTMVRDRMALPDVADNEVAIVSAIRAAQNYLSSSLDSEFPLSSVLNDYFFVDQDHFGVVPNGWFSLRLRRMLVREDLYPVEVWISKSLGDGYVLLDETDYIVDAPRGVIKVSSAKDKFYYKVTYRAGHSPVPVRPASIEQLDVNVIDVNLTTALTGWTGSPLVFFTGGAPVRPATGVAVMVADVISDITILDAGSGYMSSPTLSVVEGDVETVIGSGVIAVHPTQTIPAQRAMYDYSGIPEWLTSALIDLVPVVFNIGPTTERASEAGPIYDKVEKFVRFSLGGQARPVAFAFRPIKLA